MEVSVRELKNRLSEYLREVAVGREVVVTSHGKTVARLVPPLETRRGSKSNNAIEKAALANLRAQYWIQPGSGKLTLPKLIGSHKAGQKTLAEIVREQRG